MMMFMNLSKVQVATHKALRLILAPAWGKLAFFICDKLRKARDWFSFVSVAATYE